MATEIKLQDQEINESDFALENMVALLKSEKVLLPLKAQKPLIEFVSAESYKVTGLVRAEAVTTFLDSLVPTSFTATESFNSSNVTLADDGKVSWKVSATNHLALTDLLNYVHDNLGDVPDIPQPEPEPEPEAEEAPAEEEAAAEEG